MDSTLVRLTLACCLVTTPLAGQNRPTIPVDAYGQWESLGAGVLSPDGAWFVSAIRRVNEENELRLRRTVADTTRPLPFASRPVFSVNSRWLAYLVAPSPDERERLEKAKELVRNALGVFDLEMGVAQRFDGVRDFAFSPDGGFVAYHRYASDDRPGADLIVRDLTNGTSSNFGNVSAYAWADVGVHVAMTIDAGSGSANGVHVYSPADGALRVLESSDATYRGLSWRDDDRGLAVLKTLPADSLYADTAHVALVWPDGVRGGSPRTTAGVGGLDGLRIAEHRTPSWSEDGRSIYLGLRPRDPRVAEADSSDEDEPSDVQVWHARDFRIIPMQKAQEQRDLRATMLAVWPLESDHVVRIGSDLHERVTVLAGDDFALETESEPHRFEEMFGRVYDDLHLIDLATGERRPVAARVRHVFGGSATGRYLLYFLDEDYWVYDVGNHESRNLTAGIDAQFANLEYDYPVRQFPPFGVAGWVEDDAAVLVYDKFDVWRIDPVSGRGARMTDGADEMIRYRRVRFDRDEEAIDLDVDQYFTMNGDRTKRSGVARWRPNGAVETLLYEDARVSRLARAESTDVFIFAHERFDDSPDFLVAGADLAGARPLTETNPFQDEYAWSRSALVDFTSQTGRDLQAALLYPANYDSSRRYPMIVYNYEILSNRLHWYVAPSERSYYNFTAWTQHGYFVLLPDIVYRGRDPGRSAVEAIVPAVQSVVDRGLVDPARVGLVGHSWGGYQATYVPTQTNIFAASVAGAPLTNFLSMMGAIHWNPGLPETGHWETGQARMEVPFWEDFDAHVRNSPAAFVDQLETPMLMTFGDADGVVDWRQGVEFYNYARRAGKDDFVMLVYPGEDHGLRKKQNQIDYHRRILQWFGHYLKGDPAPDWLVDGVTYLDRKKDITTGSGGR